LLSSTWFFAALLPGASQSQPDKQRPDKSGHLFVSIVVLRRQYRPLGQAEIEKAVEAAYDVSIDPKSQNSNTPAKNLVVPINEHSFLVRTVGMSLQVNNSAQPYSPDPVKDALSFSDAKWQRAWREHRSWISVDLIRADGASGAGVLREYPRLGKLLAQFVDDNCLGAYIPGPSERDTDHFIAMSPELRKELLNLGSEQ
jgi:hypothetical protein